MQDAGAIRIDLDLADGLICAAAIRSTRPLGLARLFEGRPAAEAPVLASRLFTLCAQAQRAASAAAIRAAQGRQAEEASLRQTAVAVAAERLFETLRSLTLGWPGCAAPSRPHREALRDAALSAAGLATRGGKEAFERLRGAAARLGFDADTPPPDSPLGAALRESATLALTPPDPLQAEDDAAVARALANNPTGFAAAPELPGRRPETGAYARLWRDIPETRDALSARAHARFLDARRSLDELAALIAGAAPPHASGRTGEREGYGAVECARGRLFHWARLDANDAIAAYAILAPTEWNFHPNGPLAAGLIGARASSAKAARDVALKLAALIDPCVGFEVEVREAA